MGRDVEIKNAIIKSADITDSDRGLLDAWLHLDYGGAGQGFGGYALYLPKSYTHHELKSVAGHHIWRCMEIAGASKWSALSGKTIRVRVEDGLIRAIGHIVKDDWYCPADDFKDAKPPKTANAAALLARIYENLANDPFGMGTPWESKAKNGKPLLYGGKRGLLAYSTIGTWDEFDLIVEVINNLPDLLRLAATAPPAGDWNAADIKAATIEYLAHRGDSPRRVLPGGSELWETHIPAMTAALGALTRPTPSAPEPEGGEQPVAWAWRYELATGITHAKEYVDWRWHLTERKPNVPEGSIRNLTPLYARSSSPAPAATPEKRDV